MILLLDNYDSFTFNLYQLVGSINPDIKVVRNDKLTVREIKALAPSHLIISPGPGRPSEAGICEEAIAELKGTLPILGVCLGHQAIGEVFGGKVVAAPELVHGKQSKVFIKKANPLFAGMEQVFTAARYHSLIVAADSLPPELINLAETEGGEIMALKHRDYDVYGVQFHPESIMTPAGEKILVNFLQMGDNN